MQQTKSPYEVPVMSVAPALAPDLDLKDHPLQAFERDQLKYLINQIKAASPRVRQALANEVFPYN